MARDRQRSKQRQAERRAARLAATGGGAPRPVDAREGDGLHSDRLRTSEDAAEVAAGAPPENTGRSDTVVAPTPASEPIVAQGPVSLRERGAPTAAPERERGRVATFLAGVVAELRRVQWPGRAQVTSLTGIVLGFVLLAGGYLGLLDAVFSRLIRLIL